MTDADSKLKEGIRERASQDLKVWYEQLALAVEKRKAINRAEDNETTDIKPVASQDSANRWENIADLIDFQRPSDKDTSRMKSILLSLRDAPATRSLFMSLADSFLADLEDIEGGGVELPANDSLIKAEHMEDVPETGEQSQDVPLRVESSTTSSSRLLSDPNFQQFMSRIRANGSIPITQSMSRSDESFQLISDSNSRVPLIVGEVGSLSKQIEEIYRKRFPELGQIVVDPTDYVRVVSKLGNEFGSVDLTVLLQGLVSSSIAVSVAVTASTSGHGVRLNESDLRRLNSLLHLANQLLQCKQDIIEFLSARMSVFAPNLVAVIGSPLLVAHLVSAAGGLENLATMPSQNIESVGAQKKSQAGFSSNSVQSRMSLVSQCDLVVDCPEETKKRAVRLVLGKAAIAARVDQFGQDTLARTGKELREFILSSLDKANEPPPARAVKPLPIPADLTAPRTRRGGKRHRRMKEKYGQTEIQKQAKRVRFGEQGEIDSGFVNERSTGMVGMEMGAGRIRKLKAKKGVVGSNAPGNSLSLNAVTGIQLQTVISKPVLVAKDIFSNSVSFNKN